MKKLAEQILPLLDLTRLIEDDLDEAILALCNKACTPHGYVAAVCVYPAYVSIARKALTGTPVKVATVVNFPRGNQSLPDVLAVINKALAEGANEIDVVFPYQQYIREQNLDLAQSFVGTLVESIRNRAPLKVILETGALPNILMIGELSKAVLAAGAHFVKTSTGKIPTGATLEAAEVMLSAIQSATTEYQKTFGFKAAGGICTITQAGAYIDLARRKMGDQFIHPNTFRIGASQLFDEIMAVL